MSLVYPASGWVVVVTVFPVFPDGVVLVRQRGESFADFADRAGYTGFEGHRVSLRNRAVIGVI